MPSRERGSQGGDPDDTTRRERQPAPYQRAARFRGEKPAGRAYERAQRVIYEARQPTDVSVYRLQFNQLWHVAALGLVPPAPVLKALETILATGEAVELPADVWQALAERRRQATRRGPWSEGHYRPGQRL